MLVEFTCQIINIECDKEDDKKSDASSSLVLFLSLRMQRYKNKWVGDESVT